MLFFDPLRLYARVYHHGEGGAIAILIERWIVKQSNVLYIGAHVIYFLFRCDEFVIKIIIHVLALGCIDPVRLELRAIRHLKLVELDAVVLVDFDFDVFVLLLLSVRKSHSKGSNQRIVLRVERPGLICVARMWPVFARGTLAQIMIQEEVKNRK